MFEIEKKIQKKQSFLRGLSTGFQFGETLTLFEKQWLCVSICALDETWPGVLLERTTAVGETLLQILIW